MLIKQKNEYISGMLFTLENKTFKPKFMGIVEDKIPLLKQGLGAATYYFSILWAKENSAKLIDFGGTTLGDIEEFFLHWGDTSAATLGGKSKTTVTGGHGNGGKFYMREMWQGV